MTIGEILTRFADTRAEDWTALACGAWKHVDAHIGPATKILGPCIFRGGEFSGGIFHGGEFHGGLFRAGAFLGGTFMHGLFRGAGIFRSGVFRRGNFYGGSFCGDVIVHDGTFYGGHYPGGEITKTPLQIAGSRHFVNVCSPDKIAIGCRYMTYIEWLGNYERLGAEHEYSAAALAEYRRHLDYCAQAMSIAIDTMGDAQVN